MKRGEISMEVIIIAAIALLVLVILSVLVIRSGGTVAKECQNVGGTCVGSADECTSSGGSASLHSCGSGLVCCIRTTNEQV
jgi:hypothetical protein